MQGWVVTNPPRLPRWPPRPAAAGSTPEAFSCSAIAPPSAGKILWRALPPESWQRRTAARTQSPRWWQGPARQRTLVRICSKANNVGNQQFNAYRVVIDPIASGLVGRVSACFSRRLETESLHGRFLPQVLINQCPYRLGNHLPVVRDCTKRLNQRSSSGN